MSDVCSQPRLILASASPRRRVLLGETGLAFEVVVSGVDESQIDVAKPGEFAKRAALEKCLNVVQQVEDSGAVVIGADTVVCFDALTRPAGAPWMLGKPADRDEARRMLGWLSGRTHCVITGVAVHSARHGSRVEADTSFVTFRKMKAAEIASYLATGESLDKAGAYGIQGAAIPYIEKVEGDLLNVIGLPLHLLVEMLRVDGFDCPKRERKGFFSC